MSRVGITVLNGLKLLVRNKIITEKFYLSIRFLMTFKRLINWEHPCTLNEKLQVYKLLIEGQSKYSIAADKLAVREWVSKRASVLFPHVIFKTTNPKDFQFEGITQPIVIKANHGSGWYDIIREPKKIVDWNARREEYTRWLKKDFYHESIEPQYKNIKPTLFGEEMMIPSDGEDIIDYKFHCINGELAFIHVASDRTGETKRNFFDAEWNELDMYWGPVNRSRQPARRRSKTLKKPNTLKQMIEVANTLAKEFPYVRVDLYTLNDNIYFGELTFQPGAGLESFVPEKYDAHYGAMLNLAVK